MTKKPTCDTGEKDLGDTGEKLTLERRNPPELQNRKALLTRGVPLPFINGIESNSLFGIRLWGGVLIKQHKGLY